MKKLKLIITACLLLCSSVAVYSQDPDEVPIEVLELGNGPTIISKSMISPIQIYQYYSMEQIEVICNDEEMGIVCVSVVNEMGLTVFSTSFDSEMLPGTVFPTSQLSGTYRIIVRANGYSWVAWVKIFA